MKCFLPLLFACVASAEPSPTSPTSPMTSADGWFRHEDGHVELWRAGKLVRHAFPGSERWDDCIYEMPPQARQTLGITPAPPTPGGEASRTAGIPHWQTHGVEPDKIAAAAAYEVNGRPASRGDAFRILQAGLEDDRQKCFLTAVLPDGERDKFLADMAGHPGLQAWKAKLHVNAYAPHDWRVRQIGLAEGISYQGPPDAQGRSLVKFRLRSYAGPEQLAEALRRADQNYKPDADPDPAKQPEPKSPTKPAPKDDGLNLSDDEMGGLGFGGMSLGSILIFFFRRWLERRA